MSERVVLITGSRPAKPATLTSSRTNERLCRGARAFVRTLPPDALVVTGYSIGVDRAADHAARVAGLATESWRVHWSDDRSFVYILRAHFEPGRFSEPEKLPERFRSYGHAAYWRNAKMVDMATECWAWWSESPGTANTVELAVRRGLPTVVYGPDGREVDPQRVIDWNRGRASTIAAR